MNDTPETTPEGQVILTGDNCTDDAITSGKKPDAPPATYEYAAKSDTPPEEPDDAVEYDR